tara:strand:- start:130 stop:624 length:495 start_codon:yes stop_codon:yes gene_type:complete
MGNKITEGIDHNLKQLPKIGTSVEGSTIQAMSKGKIGNPFSAEDWGRSDLMTGLGSTLDKNLGHDSAFRQNMAANMEGARAGIDHNLKQVGIIGAGVGEILAGRNPFTPKPKDPEATTSKANYSSTGKAIASRSGSGKRSKGKLSGSKDTKKQNKSSLYAKKGK